MRLVLSLYACEPNRGSEPGVGWMWALGMAKRHDTYVLTRANNREVIEGELASLRLPESKTPKFVYVDLSPLACKLKRRGLIPVSLYYLLWQFKARKVLDSLKLDADVIHHVTFNSFACPGVWWNRREKVVLGPLGGMSVCATTYLRAYGGWRRCKEFLRGLGRRFWRINVFYLLARRHADAVLFTEKAIAYRLGSDPGKRHVLLETAVAPALEDGGLDAVARKENQMAWAGALEPHKACELAIRAYAQAFEGRSCPPVLKIFGAGSDLEKCQALARGLNVSETVRFCGSVSQAALWSEMSKSKALVFTSVRDTSGNVALEALAVQTPVVCFNHQGVSEITDDACAIRVEPGVWNRSITDFAEAMKRLDGDAGLVRAMGAAGRVRALSCFSWERKFDVADAIYRTVLEQGDAHGRTR